MQPEITVLMPNYNNEPFLKEAIDSILKQTFTNFIFLIIDDGSTDKSVEIIKSYIDKRIVLIEKNNNSGIVDALNIGLAETTTKYFIRMDGDDISSIDRFNILYEFMENNPEIGVCGSDIKTFGNSNELWKNSPDKDKSKARLIFNNGVGHASAIFRTEILKNHSINYSNKHPYMEDYDLFSRLKIHTEFANVNNELYHYRILEHNSTIKNIHTRFDRYRNIYIDILSELNIDPSKENIEKHLEFFIKPTLSFNINEYKQWVDNLLFNNKKYGVYPQKALEEIINERWQQFFFKIVPMSVGKVILYFFISKKIQLNQLIYLMKYKINKLIGRK
jgi:glycosyltransferase involved in cell wall biosynthesis